MEASTNISNYLIDQKDVAIDENGNTSLHELAKHEGNLDELEAAVFNSPHLLFIINSDGCTPLDIAINQLHDTKAHFLIDKMEKYSLHSNLRFLKSPNRLELKFEKAFTLAVLKNNFSLITAFPDKSIKTVYVNMGQVADYEQFKLEKLRNPDIITTPFHLACRLSNDEAVRQLVDQQEYDINILLHGKSALYELLSTSCYLDFNILNYLMKKRKPCINSGIRLPLN